MSIPADQVNPISRKLGSAKRRPKKKAARKQTGAPKPLSTGPPAEPQPQKIYGQSKPPQQPLLNRVLDYRGLEAKGICYSHSHLRRLWNQDPPAFPKPFKPSPRRLAWWEHEIDAWLAEKARES